MPTAIATPPAVDRLVTLPAGQPELTLGWGVAAWLEEWLLQPNGPRAGKPVELTPQQIQFLLWWYAVDEAGRRRTAHMRGTTSLVSRFGRRLRLHLSSGRLLLVHSRQNPIEMFGHLQRCGRQLLQ